MDFRERKLYHQIHPLKLATDIGVTPISLYFLLAAPDCASHHRRLRPAGSRLGRYDDLATRS